MLALINDRLGEGLVFAICLTISIVGWIVMMVSLARMIGRE